MNRKAIYSILMGTAGLIITPPILSLIALAFGIRAVKEASDDRLAEKIISLVGLGLGVVGVVAWILGVLVSFVLTTWP